MTTLWASGSVDPAGSGDGVFDTFGMGGTAVGLGESLPCSMSIS